MLSVSRQIFLLCYTHQLQLFVILLVDASLLPAGGKVSIVNERHRGPFHSHKGE